MLIKCVTWLRAIADVCNRLLKMTVNQWELPEWRTVALHDEDERVHRARVASLERQANSGRKANAANRGLRARLASRARRANLVCKARPGNCRPSKR